MTTRSLRLERVYPLGDYKNIKFSDEFNEIPEHLAMNSDVIGKLYMLMMLHTDVNYFRYAQMWKEHNGFKDLDIACETLTKLIDEVTTELGIKFRNGHTVDVQPVQDE